MKRELNMGKNKYLQNVSKELILIILFASLEIGCTSFYPYILSYIIDNITTLSIKTITTIILLFVASVILLLLFSYLKKVMIAKFKMKICRNIRLGTFKSIESMSFTNFHQKSFDYYVSFLVNDVEELYTKYYENIIYGLIRMFSISIYLIILMYLNWMIGLILLGSILLVVFVPRLVGRKFDQKQLDYSTTRANYLTKSNELLQSHDLINEDNFENILDIYHKSLSNMQNKDYKLNKYYSFIQIFSGSTLYIQMIIVFIGGLLLTYFNLISIGIFASALVFTDYIAIQMSDVVNIILDIKSSKIYRDKTTYILNGDHSSKIDESVLKEPFSSLKLKDVSLKISNDFSLKNINLNIEKREKYLITGRNGSGKSTLAKVIAGFIIPETGNILLNDKKANQFSYISYIYQKRYIFEGTLLDNITMFSKSVNSKKIERIKSTMLLVKLDYDVNHVVKRDGNNLSGGEIAKICLIRELYRDKEVLLLDEPFNDIDDKTRNDILNFLHNIDKTVIVISHALRAEEIQLFDRLIVIDGGVIIKNNSTENMK